MKSDFSHRTGYLFCIIFCLLWMGLNITPLYAQERSFPASKLREMTIRYTGNSANWPVVVALADHNISKNTFHLSADGVQRLKNFGGISQKVSDLEHKINNSIKSGATVFAKEPLDKSNDLIDQYQRAVKNGDLRSANKIVKDLSSAVSRLDSTLSNNRMVNIQAKLARKEGDVDKRRGLLGAWTDALIGDLFKEADGIKTYKKSFANLSFVDGSQVVVNPQTVAVIRKSRIDKLDKSVDTQISLNDGGLLAKLSAQGKDKGNYVLNAGSSQTRLKSQKFLAEAEGSKRVKLTNYDGTAEVNANEISITIHKNEGTIVESGKNPIQPVKLVDPPELMWARPDTIIYRDSLMVSFLAKNRARSYRIETSSSRTFDENVHSYTTRNTSVLLQNLPLGISYVRVQSVDSLGLRGPQSENYRIIRNQDTQPPPLFLTGIHNETLYIGGDSLTLKGVSEPGAKVTINGKQLPIQPDGSFSKNITVSQDETEFPITATDHSDNTTTRTITIIRVNPKRLLQQMKWNATVRDNQISMQDANLVITGIAYPGFEIILRSGSTQKSVKTDMRGRWGTTISLPGKNLEFKFINNNTGEVIFSKQYTIVQ